LSEAKQSSIRVLGVALALFATIASLVFISHRPPAPRPANAPATEFSAARAREVLRQLVGGGVPHPVGSANDEAVRDRIVAILTQLGYKPEIQTGFACNSWGSCAAVRNVVARLDGRGSGLAVLLCAHYDSVPAGPGASDDGAGVAAVLEIARVLKVLAAPKNPIIILLDEGEEAGLLGAYAFVEKHPWAKEVRAAVNVDARGSSGPSFMFETGSANDWLMCLYSSVVPHPLEHPMTSSIYYVAYKHLPVDTDFTVFKAVGYQGFNFAYIGGVVHYHTPLDDFGNADPRSLQHHGENALATLVALANANLEDPPRGEAVFFDVFARWVVHWPVGYTLPIVFVAAALLLLETIFLVQHARLAPRKFLWGLLAWLVAMVIAAALALLLLTLFKVGRAFPSNWVAHPFSAELAFWCMPFVAVFLTIRTFVRRTDFWGLWTATWTWWTLAALALAWLEPGVSYVFVVPSASAALCGAPAIFAREGSRWRKDLASMVPAAAAAIVGFSSITGVYDALGVSLLPCVTVLIALVLTTLLPIFSDAQESYPGASSGLLGGSLGIAVVATIVALLMPAYSAQAPERLNIDFLRDDDTGKSQWAVEPDSRRLPASLQQAISSGWRLQKPFPWSHDPVFVADAPNLDLPGPTLSIYEDSPGPEGKRTYRALLRSRRGASVASIVFPPSSGVAAVSVNGHRVPEIVPQLRQWLNGWQEYRCRTMPPDGVEVGFELGSASPTELYVTDETYGLPQEGLFLQKARPVTAVPSQSGDATIVSRPVRISP
jgi:hypothetical protein